MVMGSSPTRVFSSWQFSLSPVLLENFYGGIPRGGKKIDLLEHGIEPWTSPGTWDRTLDLLL